MKCICCDKIICPIYNEKPEEDYLFPDREVEQRWVGSDISSSRTASTLMWSEGIIGEISAGYGSKHDGCVYTISICDDCVEKKQETGSLAYTSNYIFPDDKEIEKYKKIWRRNNNIDKLDL